MVSICHLSCEVHPDLNTLRIISEENEREKNSMIMLGKRLHRCSYFILPIIADHAAPAVYTLY